MAHHYEKLIGLGIYTIPEASRLSRVSRPRIRRWLAGYAYKYKKEQRSLPAVWEPELPGLDGQIFLSFLDLLEIRFINAFVNQGISLQKIRIIATSAAEILEHSHPFSTRKFKTDGRTIYLYEVVEKTGQEWLIDLFTKQYKFKRVIWPSLYRGLEYEADDPLRWWPLHPRRRVVIDPKRAFGQPIVNEGGVPTGILADAVKAEGSIERVAKWYDLPTSEVADAVKFERALAA